MPKNEPNMVEITDEEFHPELYEQNQDGFVNIHPDDPSKAPPYGGVSQGTLYNIAHAARRKTGTTELKIPEEIPGLIESIPDGNNKQY